MKRVVNVVAVLCLLGTMNQAQAGFPGACCARDACRKCFCKIFGHKKCCRKSRCCAPCCTSCGCDQGCAAGCDQGCQPSGAPVGVVVPEGAPAAAEQAPMPMNDYDGKPQGLPAEDESPSNPADADAPAAKPQPEAPGAEAAPAAEEEAAAGPPAWLLQAPRVPVGTPSVSKERGAFRGARRVFNGAGPRF